MDDSPSVKGKLLEAVAARQEPSAVSQPKLSNAVSDGRKLFNLAVEDEILDYLHNHPSVIENCLKTLIKIFGNILQHPTEGKYRQIKASSNTLRINVCNIKGGEHLLVLAGWTTQVVELQKHWVFDAAPGSTKFGFSTYQHIAAALIALLPFAPIWCHSILEEAYSILEHALHTIHVKLERQAGTSAGKRVGEEAARKAILMHIEDDKASRKARAESTALVTPVKAHALPSEQAEQTGASNPKT